jgi:small basic protein
VIREVNLQMKRSLLGEVNGYLNRQSKPFLVTSGFTLVLLVAVVDYITGAELSVSIFYLIPISLSVFFVNTTLA